MTLAATRGLTEEQRAAVQARGGSVIVSANAGSGKTSVLVERFTEAVLGDGAAVGAILAITFSDKAANQLRERIRARFLERGAEGPAREVGDAHISTIHAFCASALRAHALQAGLDPDFAILDEDRAQRRAVEACDGAFEDGLTAHGAAALDVMAAYGAPALRALLVDLHGRLRSRGEAAPELPAAPPRRDLGPRRAELADAARAAAVYLGAGRPELKSVRKGLAALERCTALLETDDEEELRSLRALSMIVLGNGGSAELQSEECGRYRAALTAYRHACVDRQAEPIYTVAATLLRAFTTRYAQLKRAGGWLDFDDLELAMADLLRTHPTVAERWARRFDLVMVDEFQDVNARQLAIVDAIARDNLFLVGDEFQSIYGFRHAELELFRARRAELEARGAARSLRTNFRAHEQLLDALNVGMGPRLGERFLALRAGRALAPDGEPPFVEVLVTEQEAWRDRGDADGAPPPDLGEAVPGTTRWRLAEARLLAQHVRDLLDSTRYCPRDVVVLLRATGDMAVFERALEDQGVPTYLVGGRGYWRHPQVRDLVAWLAVLANPDDTLALYEVLASPLVGCSSDGLVLLATVAERLERSPWWTLHEAAANTGDGSQGLLDRLGSADRDALVGFVHRLLRERSAAVHRTIEETIDRAVVDTGYDLRVLAMPGGQRRMANVRKLMRLAREHESQEGRHLRTFLGLVDSLADEGWGAHGAEGEAPMHSEVDGTVEGSALDAVRIMTIHRAKGLEFPVVYVADLGRPSPRAGDIVVLGDDGRVGVRLRTAEGESEDAFHRRELVEERGAREFEEEQRLFYVAMTRAEERLVLSGAIPRVAEWPDPKPGCPPLTWIGPALVPEIHARLSVQSPVLVDHDRLRWEGRAAPVRCVLNAPETIGAVLAQDALAPARAPALVDRGASPRPPAPPPAPSRAPVVPRVSYSSLEDYARCGYRFYLQRVSRLPPREVSAPTFDDALASSARLRGTVAHELLERVDFAAPATPSLADVQAAAAAHDGALDAAAAEEVIKLVERFADSALRARLAAAGAVRREMPFAFPLAVGDLQPLLVTGVVDAMTGDGVQTLVVDYKSDRVAGQSLPELVDRAYATQRLIYALAALRAGAERVEVIHCFLERPDEPVVAEFFPGDAPRLESALLALARGLLEERFEVTPRPDRELCSGCPGRGTLCSWDLQATLADPSPG